MSADNAIIVARIGDAEWCIWMAFMSTYDWDVPPIDSERYASREAALVAAHDRVGLVGALAESAVEYGVIEVDKRERSGTHQQDEIARLRAHNATLRAALEKVGGVYSDNWPRVFDDPIKALDEVGGIVGDALATTPDEALGVVRSLVRITESVGRYLRRLGESEAVVESERIVVSARRLFGEPT